MPQITKYVCVKVVIEVPEIIEIGDKLIKDGQETYASQDELAEEAINECDYSFVYDGGDVHIVDTEIVGIQDHPAVGI